jgi:hypothetical protein
VKLLKDVFMEEFLAEIFTECMILNKRYFSETDFKLLLKSQRLDEDYNIFNDKVSEYIDLHEIDYYYFDDGKWYPKCETSSHIEIAKIINELELHMELEFSLDDFCETSCDIVQKINNYLWLCEDKTLK